MSKKVIGALLAIVMVLSVFSFTVFAAGGLSYETDATKTQTWGLMTNKDDPTKVDVVLSTNYPVGPISFKVEGIKSLDDAVLGADYYSNSRIDFSDDGLVMIYPDTDNNMVEGKELNKAVVATLTYTKDTASNAEISIKNDPKDDTSAATTKGTLMAARISAQYVNYSDFIVGQTCTIYGLDAEWEDVPVTPPAGGDDVTLTGVNGAVVDDAKGFVYGIPGKTADIKTFLSTTGFIDVVANDANSTNGTGAVINLYSDSTKATLVKSYTLVIFGDLDGDGEAALPDAGILSQYANYVTESDSLSGAYYFAGDLDGDGEAALPDAGILSQYANYVTETITINPFVGA